MLYSRILSYIEVFEHGFDIGNRRDPLPSCLRWSFNRVHLIQHDSVVFMRARHTRAPAEEEAFPIPFYAAAVVVVGEFHCKINITSCGNSDDE